VEYYFSRHNLLQDSFLLSKMDKDFFVDVCVIAGFKMMKQLTTDVDLIMSSVKGSDKVIVDETKKRIKPAPNHERTTLILRNIPTSASEQSVVALLKSVAIPSWVSIRADVGDNWFVSFETQEATKTALERVKTLKWDDKQIGCAIKSESFLKGLALMPNNGSQFQISAPFIPGVDTGFRANGRRVNSGRRNLRHGGANDALDANGKKSGVKKSKGRNGSRDGSVKDCTPGSRSPESQKVEHTQPTLKPSDFPVLGSSAMDLAGAEANSAAPTPPMCSTPPLSTPTGSNDSEIVVKKFSYAQAALSSISTAVKA